MIATTAQLIDTALSRHQDVDTPGAVVIAAIVVGVPAATIATVDAVVPALV